MPFGSEQDRGMFASLPSPHSRLRLGSRGSRAQDQAPLRPRLRRRLPAPGRPRPPGPAHSGRPRGRGGPPPPPPSRRPPLQSPPAKLTRTAGTRFTEDQFEALEEHARACGLTVTAFIRHLVLGFNPSPRRPLVRSAIVAVNRVGNNLNQLVHLANSGIILAPDLIRAVAAVLAEIHALQDVLLRADAADSSDRKS